MTVPPWATRPRPWRALLILAFPIFYSETSWSFENAEHKYISNTALTAAATDGPAPDIAKYQNLTLSWTFGINFGGVAYGKPAEQLAHLQNQSLSFKYTGPIDGGDFDAIRTTILDRYTQFNFNSEAAGQEGVCCPLQVATFSA